MSEQLLLRCHAGTRVSDNVKCCSSLSDGDWAAVAFPLSGSTQELEESGKEGAGGRSAA